MTRKTPKTLVCKHCGREFETLGGRVYFCSRECSKKYRNLKQFPDDSDYVECKICGFRGHEIFNHILKTHKTSLEDYYSKFGCGLESVMSKSTREKSSASISKACIDGKCGFQRGERNPSHSNETKSGRRSPFSMNFAGYDGLSDDEKRKRIEELIKKQSKSLAENGNNNCSLDYYLKRGMGVREAKAALSERQRTFSLKKCIERYGEEHDYEVWRKRQEKWQATLKSKPYEEIERINKAKMLNGRGYSKISQELFHKLDAAIENRFNEIFYATKNAESPEYNFNEYMVFDPETSRCFFLDFYIKDNNKVIEFDGDYWHGDKLGNQERNRIREERLKALGFTNIFHVRERDYVKNPERVVEGCLKFIYE